MQPLVIYFNEKSLLGNLPPSLWESGAFDIFHLLSELLKIRPDCEIAFLDGNWDSICGSTSLSSYFGRYKQRCRTKSQILLSKIRKKTSSKELLHEVKWSNEIAMGITYAHILQSWCFGFVATHSDWSHSHISLSYHAINEAGELIADQCRIKNWSDTDHVREWVPSLQDWGKAISTSTVVDMLKGYSIVMYPGPLEHPPAHVHVLHKNSSDTLAKYRIEDGMRENGKPTLDAEMRQWLDTYREQLLASWQRCQRGGHPYQLTKNSAP